MRPTLACMNSPPREQKEYFAAELSPELKRFAEEWKTQFAPLVSQLQESFAVGNPALEQEVRQVRDTFLRIEIPTIK